MAGQGPPRGIVGKPLPAGLENDDGSRLLALLQGGGGGNSLGGTAGGEGAAPGIQQQHQQQPPPPPLANLGMADPQGVRLAPQQPQMRDERMGAAHHGQPPGLGALPFRTTPLPHLNLLFGGNSTWSMSTQESSQGLGSLWNMPSDQPPPHREHPQHHAHGVDPNLRGPPGVMMPPPPAGMMHPNTQMPGMGGPPPPMHPSHQHPGAMLSKRPGGPNGQSVLLRSFHQGSGGGGGVATAQIHPHHNSGGGGGRSMPGERGERRDGRHGHGHGNNHGGVMNGDRGGGPRSQERTRQKYTKQPKWNKSVLQRQLRDIYLRLLPAKEEVAMKKKCFKKIQRILRKKFKESALHMFGSSANNLGICKNHDIDLSIEIDVKPSVEDDTSQSDSEEESQQLDLSKLQVGGGNGGERDKPTQQQVVKSMANLLRKNRMSRVIPIPKARVPIVKFIEPETGIECDICVNNLLAVENTVMLRKYSEIDPRLKELVILVKHWSKCRGVNGAFKGTLSSYAYVIMAIHLLQTLQPPILPCLQSNQYQPTVNKIVDGWACQYSGDVEGLFKNYGSMNKLTSAELLYQFFYYWGYRHNYKSSVISIRTGDWLTKQDKGWTTRKQGDNHLICIEDPFQLSNDLGRVVGRKTIFYLRDEFKRAADIMANAVDPIQAGLFQVLSEQEKEKKLKVYNDEVEEKRRRRKSMEKNAAGENNNNSNQK